MFVVRASGHRDNPEIIFVTPSKEIAEAVIELKDRQRYDKNRKFDTSWVASRKAKYTLSKMLISAPNIKEILGEEEYENLVQEVEDITRSYEHSANQIKLSFEEWRVKYGKDWYYEEVNQIDDLDVALALDAVQNGSY